MRYSRHLVSLRTFGLAFAVVLSPAFMQTDDFTCVVPTGDPELAELSVEVWGYEQIAFDPAEQFYEVELWSGVQLAVVRATSMDSASQVSMNYSSERGDEGLMEGVVGEGEATIRLERGESTLTVSVKAPGGNMMDYDVSFNLIN